MSNTSFQQGDACKLDFPDEPFRLSDSHGKEVVDDLDSVAFCVGNLYYFRIVFKSSLHADVEVFFLIGILSIYVILILVGIAGHKILAEDQYEKEFHGKPFKDNEIAFVYVYDEEVGIDNLTIQKEELDSVEWFDLEEVYQACQPLRDEKFCVPMGGLEIVCKYVKADERRSEGMASGMSIGMCIGIAVGVAIGAATDKIAIWMCVGMSIGMMLGMVMGNRKNSEEE